MVYKLDDADKLCGVTYIDWSKKYSKIPKATCETIKQQCSSGGGGSSDDALELSCEEIKKLLKGEDKPKEDKPKEDTPNEGNKEETPRENNTPVENNTPREETPSDNVGGNTPTEEKPTTEDVTPKENEPSPSPRVEETPAEPTPEPPVADTPREDTPTEGNASDHLGDIPTEDNQEVNLLELMPRVEDKLSTIYIQAKISSVINPNNEEKEDFERKIIETLKSKLPEGAVVEAVLGEPYYKVGMEYSEEITNYKLNVRVRLNGKVYEHEYSVPNNIEYIGITDYI